MLTRTEIPPNIIFEFLCGLYMSYGTIHNPHATSLFSHKVPTTYYLSHTQTQQMPCSRRTKKKKEWGKEIVREETEKGFAKEIGLNLYRTPWRSHSWECHHHPLLINRKKYMSTTTTTYIRTTPPPHIYWVKKRPVIVMCWWRFDDEGQQEYY